MFRMGCREEVYLVGTCTKMCSDEETAMREKRRLLHPFEVMADSQHSRRRYADRTLMVKEYVRSAAGQPEPRPCDLRPAPVLLQTVYFLMQRVMNRTNCDWNQIYDYIFDRLRAVRQDMVIQNVSGPEAVTILEIAVRFHVYAGYKLCRMPITTFDPYINQTHAQECMKRLLKLYKNIYKESNHRSEFEAIYLLYNLGNKEALHHGLAVKFNLRHSETFQTALNMSLAYYSGNYVWVLKQATKLPAIQCCAVHQHFCHIQRRVLQVMCVGYSSKNLRFPVCKLTHILKVDSDVVTESLCQQYGLNVTDGKVQFIKGAFKEEEKVSPTFCAIIDNKLDQSKLPDMITGSSEKT